MAASVSPGVTGELSFSEALEVVRATPFETPAGEPPPHGYYKTLYGPPSPQRDANEQHRLRHTESLFRFAGVTPAGKEILDVGSGFGVTLLVLACMGARRAAGVDVVGYQCDYVNAWRERLSGELADRIDARQGDAAALPFADNSFDVLLATEALQHFLDYHPFLGEAWRVLRPGGVLIISDGCNGLNPVKVRRCRRIWTSHELDEPLDPERTVFQFVRKREQIALDAFPQLSLDEARVIALNTAGLIAPQVIEAARRYLEDGVMPARRYRRGQVSVHPTQHMVMEALINPFRLKRELRRAGFKVRLRGYWAGDNGKRSHQIVDRVLGAVTPLLIFSARSLRYSAVKQR
jgi:ubiquinone/menaquinone biosynthesis C-methylase UbiE